MSIYSTLSISRAKAEEMYARYMTDAGVMSDERLGDELDEVFRSRLRNVLVVSDDLAQDDDDPDLEYGDRVCPSR